MNRIRLTACVLAIAWSAGGVAGEPEQKLVDELRDCLVEKDDARRLSCYDEMARPYQRSEPAAPRAAEAAVAAAPAQTATSAKPGPGTAAPDIKPNVSPGEAEQNFGFRGDVARAELDRKEAAASKLERLTATVTKLASLPRGELVVTLDNGQVWRQKRADPHSRLKVGDEVTIRAGSLGSFWMSGPSGRATSVNRVE